MTDDPHQQAGISPEHAASTAHRSWALTLVRYVLPAAVVIGGIVVMSLGGENDVEGGGGIVGAGLAIYFLNWLFRAGASGEHEREAEDAARDYFDAHGRWPD